MRISRSCYNNAFKFLCHKSFYYSTCESAASLLQLLVLLFNKSNHIFHVLLLSKVESRDLHDHNNNNNRPVRRRSWTRTKKFFILICCYITYCLWHYKKIWTLHIDIVLLFILNNSGSNSSSNFMRTKS